MLGSGLGLAKRGFKPTDAASDATVARPCNSRQLFILRFEDMSANSFDPCKWNPICSACGMSTVTLDDLPYSGHSYTGRQTEPKP